MCRSYCLQRALLQFLLIVCSKTAMDLQHMHNHRWVFCLCKHSQVSHSTEAQASAQLQIQTGTRAVDKDTSGKKGTCSDLQDSILGLARSDDTTHTGSGCLPCCIKLHNNMLCQSAWCNQLHHMCNACQVDSDHLHMMSSLEARADPQSRQAMLATLG